MNFKAILKPIVPHLLVVVIFIAVSFIYFSPIMQGKELPQMDNIHAEGMAKELTDYQASSGEHSAWTNSMFGGMPAYQIKGGTSYNVFVYIQRFLRLGLPYTTVSVLFAYLLGFYILLSAIGLNRWLAVVGALGFAFGSYNLIIIVAGHITKTYAIAFMAPVLGGVILIFRKKYIAGALLTLIALGVQVSTNHVQITYYLGLMVALFVIFELAFAIRNKEFAHFGKAVGILTVVSLLAVMPEVRNLWTTYEYGQESIRGKSDLSVAQGEKKSDGLDKDYALAWSYGLGESFTAIIPNVKGGASDALGSSPEALKKADSDLREYVAQQSHYWGDQPFTSGPVYFGAILCFLFILGFWLVNDNIKWWLLGATLFSFLLAWGKNFGGFTDFMFYNFPLYNKFRTVAMALVIAGVTVPLMAMLALKEIITNPDVLKRNMKGFYIALGVTAGLALVFVMMPKMFFDFVTTEEIASIAEQKAQSPQQAAVLDRFIAQIAEVRVAIFRADAWRSIIFISLAAGFLFVYTRVKLSQQVVIVGLGLLITADLWTVAKRYLNEDDFQPKSFATNHFPKTRADEYILKDQDPSYRVLNLTRSTFNDGYTPYYHKSIGGYHGAKLRRYQELIDSVIRPEIGKLQVAFRTDSAEQILGSTLQELNALNMLNTKYVIVNPDAFPLINMAALGNAWFVPNYKIVENADAELREVRSFNPLSTAIVDKRFEDKVKSAVQIPDSINKGLIKLITYKPNHLQYQTNNDKDQLAVFSEIYYSKGWNAYIDGNLTDHVRVNYVLRGMVIPAGKHMVEFKFEPSSYNTGGTISMASSGIVLLVVFALLFLMWRQVKNEPAPVVQQPAPTKKQSK